MSEPSDERAILLRLSCYSFCQALLSPPQPADLISKYFNSNPRITEHGPDWAVSRLPFLGKTFSGKDGCEEYFNVLSQTLKMHMNKDTFPGVEGFIVDAEASVNAQKATEGTHTGAVSVVGQASFESIRTGKSWEEQFIYRLSDFDEEGRIGHWEIWADPLSAWDAVGNA